MHVPVLTVLTGWGRKGCHACSGVNGVNWLGKAGLGWHACSAVNSFPTVTGNSRPRQEVFCNNNRIQRRNSRFLTISSLRREPSSTRTLKWPGRNRVQIA